MRSKGGITRASGRHGSFGGSHRVPHRLRTCAPSGGCGHSWFSNLDANPSASETESALKAAKFTTALRWINPLLHDLYHLVENFEEQHLVATCSSTRGKEQL